MYQHLTGIKALFTLIALLLVSSMVSGQQADKALISGKVKATSGDALIGVSVVLKDTRHGAATDVEGHFELANIPPGHYILQASFMGFESYEKAIEVKASQKLTENISLREKVVQMQGVEVRGKSIVQEVNEQAYAVTAISAKEFQNSTADAKEVLIRVPGVRVMEEGGLGSRINFSLNGFSGDRVKFFLDGIPMDNLGSSLTISDIPVNTIDRIEVYKGVVPVWLGTDALGGAVNIITNRKHNLLDVSYSIGSFNTHRISLNGAYTNPNTGFTFRGNINYNYSDNNYKVWAPIVEGNNVIGNAEVRRFHDRYRSGTVKLETGWVNRKFADNLLFGLLATGNDNQVQTGVTMRRVFGGITSNSQSLVPTLKYSKENLFVKGLNVSLSSAFNNTSSQFIDTLRGVTYNWLGEASYKPGSNDGELAQRTLTTLTDTEFNSQFNAGYTISPSHSLALNYALSDFRRKAFDVVNPDKIENMFPSALNKQIVGLAYTFSPGSRWNTTLFSKVYSLKTNTSKLYDFALETQRTEALQVNRQNLGYGLASTYLLRPRLQLKASYEHSYRMPLALEYFGDGRFVLPNPDIVPEKSDNLNLGAIYAFTIRNNHHLNLESNLIYREARDLIYQIVGNRPTTPFANLSQARTLGAETSFRYNFKESFHLGGSFTFQDITDRADSVYNESYTGTGYQRNFQKGYRVPNIPYLFGNASAGYTFKNLLIRESVWNLNYFFNATEAYFLSWAPLGSRDDKKIIPRQASHNLELSCSLKQGKYNIAAECRNLTDARLYDRYYLQKPGRAFYLKVRYVL